jgi:Barstar (barnase inhibitor)
MRQPVQFTSERSGVYRTPDDASRLRSQSITAGIGWFDIDFDAASGKDAGIKAIARAVGAPPDTFGANWDALADVLQDLSWDSTAAHVLHLRGQWEASMDERATLVEVLRASADYWRSTGRSFVVFIDDCRELPAWK